MLFANQGFTQVINSARGGNSDRRRLRGHLRAGRIERHDRHRHGLRPGRTPHRHDGVIEREAICEPGVGDRVL